MWLKALHRWLERLTVTTQKPHAEVLRVRTRPYELELRKAEVAPWLFPPPY